MWASSLQGFLHDPIDTSCNVGPSGICGTDASGRRLQVIPAGTEPIKAIEASLQRLRIDSSPLSIVKNNIILRLRNHLPALAPHFLNEMKSFEVGQGINERAFIHGVQTFLRIANLSSNERKQFYGSQYRGLHYATDLVTLWNKSEVDKVKKCNIERLCPTEWEFCKVSENFHLVYKGQQPSQALDQLLAGPCVIDCGMFCQLAMWFGIKSMLGNKKFNEVFARAPFFITQLFYTNITDPKQPQLGNPLFPFLSKEKSRLMIKYIPNHFFYTFKHPGGNANGHHCVVIDDQITIFDPEAPVTEKSGLMSDDVLEILRKALNTAPGQDVADQLEYYAQTPDTVHPSLSLTYKELIEAAKRLSSISLDTAEFLKEIPSCDEMPHSSFDVTKFQQWITRLDTPLEPATYTSLKDAELRIPKDLENEIPHENRSTMSFERYRRETPLQQSMYQMGLNFCADVSMKKSILLTVTGTAGVGKTATAVSCAKELVSRGKSVVWISESTVFQWAACCTTIEEYLHIRKRLDQLLSTNPDVVFLDDNNLASQSGKALLEVIYEWYVTNPGKGLFISSNVDISFKDCFGPKLDGYHTPPFHAFDSEGYMHRYTMPVTGVSQRPALEGTITKLDDFAKLVALKDTPHGQDGRSIGVIVSSPSYNAAIAQKLLDSEKIEFVPGFEEGWIDEIYPALKKHDILQDIPGYQKLSEVQKAWTRRYIVYEHTRDTPRRLQRSDIPDFLGIGRKSFVASKQQIIAVELFEATHWSGEKIVNPDDLDQLILACHYCFDQGKRKLIIINRTNFPHDHFLQKILQKVRIEEKERVRARLNDLLSGWKSSVVLHG